MQTSSSQSPADLVFDLKSSVRLIFSAYCVSFFITAVLTTGHSVERASKDINLSLKSEPQTA
jgi:hypothetical protein